MFTPAEASRRLTAHLRASRARMATEPEQGDVPGWVLVTVMTAGLVTTLWVLADDQLKELFSSALGRVAG